MIQSTHLRYFAQILALTERIGSPRWVAIPVPACVSVSLGPCRLGLDVGLRKLFCCPMPPPKVSALNNLWPWCLLHVSTKLRSPQVTKLGSYMKGRLLQDGSRLYLCFAHQQSLDSLNISSPRSNAEWRLPPARSPLEVCLIA